MPKPCNLQKTVSAKLSYSAAMRVKATPPRIRRSAKRVLVIIFFIIFLFCSVKNRARLVSLSSTLPGTEIMISGSEDSLY